MTEYLIVFSGFALLIWSGFTYHLWGRLQSRGQALAICHEAMREYEERLRFVTTGNQTLQNENANLRAQLGGDTEGCET